MIAAHVNRPALLAIVEAILADPAFGPSSCTAYWAEDDGESYGRNESGGSFVELSIRSRRVVGRDAKSYVKGAANDDTFSTEYTAQRVWTWSLRCESDAASEVNTASEILEAIAERLLAWDSWILQLLEARIVVQRQLGLSDAPVLWDGRTITAAVLDLECYSNTVQLDTSEGTATLPGGSDFYNANDDATGTVT